MWGKGPRGQLGVRQIYLSEFAIPLLGPGNLFSSLRIVDIAAGHYHGACVAGMRCFPSFFGASGDF